MKKPSELKISQAPWRFTDDGMGDCDIRCSGVTYGEGYEGDDIIASGVQKKDAQMFAAAPKLYKGLYDAWHQICLNPNTKCKDCAFNGLLCSEWRSALEEASGEGAVEGKQENAMADLDKEASLGHGFRGVNELVSDCRAIADGSEG